MSGLSTTSVDTKFYSCLKFYVCQEIFTHYTCRLIISSSSSSTALLRMIMNVECVKVEGNQTEIMWDNLFFKMYLESQTCKYI